MQQQTRKENMKVNKIRSDEEFDRRMEDFEKHSKHAAQSCLEEVYQENVWNWPIRKKVKWPIRMNSLKIEDVLKFHEALQNARK